MWSLLETGTSCHSRATGFTPGIWCGPCWRQGLLAIQGRLGSLQVFGVVLVGDRDFLPFEGDWVHSRFLVGSLLETGTSCHSRATGFTPGFWWGPCWRQGPLAIQGRLSSLQVVGVVLVAHHFSFLCCMFCFVCLHLVSCFSMLPVSLNC